jgi:signal transduction histidine kinase
VIWWNLLQNALRHGGPSPQIRLAWSPGKEGCRFSVADRGAPIEPVVQARLFRPFDQLHLVASPSLGLSIVQRLVALQDGQCGYERQADGSSVFFFTLPDGKAGRGRAKVHRQRSSSGVKPVGGGR